MLKVFYISLILLLVAALGCQLGGAAPDVALSPDTEENAAPIAAVTVKIRKPTPTTWPSTTLDEAWNSTLSRLTETEKWAGETGIMVAQVQSRGAIEGGRARRWDMIAVSADEQKFAIIQVRGGDVEARDKGSDAGLHRPFFQIDEYLDTEAVAAAAWMYMDTQGLRKEHTSLSSISIRPIYPECKAAFRVSFKTPLTTVCIHPFTGETVWSSKSDVLQ